MPYSFLLSNIHVHSTVYKFTLRLFYAFLERQVTRLNRLKCCERLNKIHSVCGTFVLFITCNNERDIPMAFSCFCLFGAVDSIGQTKLRYVSCDTNDIRMKMIVIFISGFVSWGQLCRYILVCNSVELTGEEDFEEMSLTRHYPFSS